MSDSPYPRRWTSQVGHWVDSGPRVWLQNRNPWKIAAACGLACLVVFLTFFNLAAYPYIDGDEGTHLLFAKELAVSGKYTFGPAVGPTILLPVALAMRLFGVSLLPARLVMALYMLLSVAVFYALARQLGDWKTSLMATLLYVINPGINLTNIGRKVVGEVPATLFALAAMLVWFTAVDDSKRNRRLAKLVLSGIFLGLAILSKNQFLLLLPAWLVVWIFDRVYYRQARHSDFLLPVLTAIVVLSAWYLGQALFFPNGQQLAVRNSIVWSDALGRGIFTISPQRMWAAFQFLTDQNTFYGLLIPVCLYALLRSVRRSREGLHWAMLLTVTIVWLIWFTFLSVAWYRYAFPALTLAAIVVAHFFSDATGGFRIPWNKLASLRSSQWDAALVVRLILMALLAVILVRALSGRFYDLTSRLGTSFEQRQMASYVVEHVPLGAVIETFDPGICFLSGHTCHLPPGDIQDAVIKYGWYGGPPPYQYYHLEDLDAPYLLIGGWSRGPNLYDMEVVNRTYELLASIGEYSLYRAKPAN